MSSPEDVRGPDAVKAALIDAAAEALSAAGPSSVSVRAVARAANVNHGQVHHYFGGKRALLRAAMQKLATEHFEFMMGQTGESNAPPPLLLAEDRGYWRAVCQCVMEGDLDLVRTEFEEGVSVPQTLMKRWSKDMGVDPDDLDFKASFAMLVCLQLGWVSLENFLASVVEVDDADRDALRSRVKKQLTEGWASVDQVLAPWIARQKAGPGKG